MPGGPARSPPLCVWTLPPGDDDFSSRWRLIKTIFARSLAADERRSDAPRRHQERGIWQRRFWEPSIRDDSDFAAHGFQTRLCRGGRRLAVFHVQGLRSARALSCRLAWTIGTNPIRQRSRRMTPFGGLRFALNPPYVFRGVRRQRWRPRPCAPILLAWSPSSIPPSSCRRNDRRWPRTGASSSPRSTSRRAISLNRVQRHPVTRRYPDRSSGTRPALRRWFALMTAWSCRSKMRDEALPGGASVLAVSSPNGPKRVGK
jgi:hypothetical protein